MNEPLRIVETRASVGEEAGCDFAVVGVGIHPDVPAIAGSLVDQDNGILVDDRCRSSAADVYAAGDVANHLHPVLGRIRVEHCNSAEHHGAAAARAMLGSAAPFDYVHQLLVRPVRAHPPVRRPRYELGRLRRPREPPGGQVHRFLPGRRGRAGRRRLRPRGRSGVGARLRDGGQRAHGGQSRTPRPQRAPRRGADLRSLAAATGEAR
jgi:NADPH-dependent 2,4-dienoyl-CoA reductase/sulfur reductase-like enzyme